MTPAGTRSPGEGAMAPIGILGGTFDPVHNGHLRSALEVLEHCRLGRMRLIPAGSPPLRAPPTAPAELRLRMLRAAVADEPRLEVDDREIRRPGPSYTVDTLTALRAESGKRPLCMVLGADAFLGLAAWHRWRELCSLAHLIIIPRPGCELLATGELRELLAARQTEDVGALHRATAGAIRVQPVTRLEISSSAIRALAVAGGDVRFLVPDAVRDVIIDSACYQRTAGAAAGSTEAQLRA